MPTTLCVAVDPGAVTTRVARADGPDRVAVSEVPSALVIGPAGIRTGTAALGAASGTDEVLQGFLPLLAGDPATLRAAGWTSTRSPADAAALLFEQLDLPGPPDPAAELAVAVPDSWWDGVSGAAAREELRRSFERAGVPGPARLVERSVAAVAHWAESDRTGVFRRTVLVCDIGARTVSATVCRCEAATITPVESVTSGPPAGAAFEQHATAAGDGPAVPRHVDALRRAIASDERRADAVLVAATTTPRYRDTPVYEIADPRLVLTAADVERCFRPVGATIAGVLTRLITAVPALADELDAVLVTGGFGRFTLTVEAVRSGLAALPGADRRSVRVLDGDAVARGLMLIARGDRVVGSEAGPSIDVVVHRVRSGRLEEGLLPLTRDGRPAGPAEPAAEAGHTVEIEVARAAGRERRRWTAAALPAGSYRLGWWPGRTGDGVLVLRAQAGPAVLVAVADLTPSTGLSGKADTR